MSPSIAAATPELLFPVTIRWGAIGPLMITSLVIMGSPGPATISITAAGSAFGARRSLRYMMGIVVGTVIVLIAVATGVTAALLAVPVLRVALTAVSVAYILWLAYRIATAPPLAARATTSAAPSLAGGILLGVANPKAWLAIAATFASARLATTATIDVAAKIAVLSVMIALIMTAWLIAGTSLAALLRNPKRARIINIASAVTLVGATALTVLSQETPSGR